MNAARFRWNTKRNIFPLAFLPSDVVLLICDFLSHKDKANLSRVNRNFREIFRSPQAWKGTTTCFKSSRNWKVVDRHLAALLETVAARRITFVELSVLDLVLIPRIFQYLPRLEGLSLPVTTSESARVLQECVKGNCSLRKLHLGELKFTVRGCHRMRSRLCYLFKTLKFLEDVSFGHLNNFVKLSTGNQASYGYGLTVKALISALCANGKLFSLAINDCQLESSSIQEILEKNAQIHTLRLCHVRIRNWNFSLDNTPLDGAFPSLSGTIDALGAKLCPELRTLDLTSTISTSCFFHWFTSHAGKISVITSLNLTNCTDVSILSNLSKFSDVQELNLTQSNVSDHMLKKLDLAQLRSLELRACRSVSGDGVMYLSISLGRTLQYLGLANCENISSHHLRILIVPPNFPKLRSLDLSCCKVSDEILANWYLNSCAMRQPQLRKLKLAGCEAVTQATVDLVRLKTRNCLSVDR